jgi:hypothetical protein
MIKEQAKGKGAERSAPFFRWLAGPVRYSDSVDRYPPRRHSSNLGLLASVLVAACATSPAPVPSAAAPPPSVIMAKFESATAAIRALDFASAEGHLEAALVSAPGHPLLIEQLMRVRARLRDSSGVLEALRLLAPIGSARAVRGDTLYDFLLPNTEFERLTAVLSGRSQPVVRSDTAAAISEEDLLVESIALRRLSNSQRELILGSMRTGRILAAPLGGSSTRTVLHSGGRVLGLKLDERDRLWANIWFSAARDSTGAAPASRSELAVISLPSGRIERVFSSPSDGGPHLFNDVAFDSRGHAYITDSESHAVYRVSRTLQNSEPRLLGQRSGDFTAPNGIAASRDGHRLYVAHVEGISVWDLRNGSRTLLRSVPGVPTTGVDGLYVCGNALIAMQNVAGIDRVAWLDLAPDGMSVVGGKVLEQRHPAARQPTTGVVDGDQFFYVATSDVARQRSAGPLLPATGPRNTVVLRLKLSVSCT